MTENRAHACVARTDNRRDSAAFSYLDRKSVTDGVLRYTDGDKHGLRSSLSIVLDNLVEQQANHRTSKAQDQPVPVRARLARSRADWKPNDTGSVGGVPGQ